METDYETSERRPGVQLSRDAGSPALAGLMLSVVVPTFNEVQNLGLLIERLADHLGEISWEAVVVDDDSPDGTARLAQGIAGKDQRVRLIHRIGRRGLASACIEGFLASKATYVAVIDADLQHDETVLLPMLTCLRADGADCMVGSRYLGTGEIEGWHRQRVAASRLATVLTRSLTSVQLTDPMSGLFMIRRDAVLPLIPRLSGVGFKILLDILLTAPEPLRVVELPYQFKPRERDQSKFDSRAAYDFAYLILDKAVGRWVPIRFVSFVAVGALGLLVHLAIVWCLFRLLGSAFLGAQIVATVVAMTSNFLLNNELTYRDRRLRGRAMLRGWLSFVVACSLGALVNIAVARYLFAIHESWWLAAMAGAAAGAVWNYALTRVYTWSPR